LDEVLNKYIRDKNGKKQIFVVDDDDERLDLSASVLEPEYKVMTMLSVGKVFILLEKKKPDIILINEEMSGKDEDSVIKRLREYPEYRDISVILLEKSFEPKTLPDIVKDHIENEKGVKI
jgi:CheY-like chemotaxis protein